MKKTVMSILILLMIVGCFSNIVKPVTAEKSDNEALGEGASKKENDEIEQEDTESKDNDTFTIVESEKLAREQYLNHQDQKSNSMNLAKAPSPWWLGSQGSRKLYTGYGELVGGGNSSKIIDVSEWQGVIDWETLKRSGEMDGAIVRCGYGSAYLDAQFARNISELNRLKIPYGIYLYSYSADASDATMEANFVKSILKNYNVNLSYPIYYDIEAWPGGGYYRNGKWVACPTTPNQYKTVISTFLNNLHSAGYTNTHVYSYRSYMQNQLNDSSILKWTSWIAEYGPRLNYSGLRYTGISGWQYTSDGTVPGVNGRVDISGFHNYYGTDTENTIGAQTGKNMTDPTLFYQAKSNKVGWLNEFSELNTAGTTGRSLDMFNLKVRMVNVPNSANLSAELYSSNYGTMHYQNISEQTILGKDNQTFQKIHFDLNNVPGYRLEYRVHSVGLGWQSWVSQGNTAGAAGKNIQAIEFRLVRDEGVIVNGPQLYYRTHSQQTGWGKYVGDSAIAGTMSQSLRLESLNVGFDNVSSYQLSGELYVKGKGWVSYSDIKPNTLVGTLGESREITAMKFNIAGIAGYKIQYRIHVANMGWLSWADQNQIAGSSKSNLQVEAIQIRLVKSTETRTHPEIFYRGHIQSKGWLGAAKNGGIAGTAGLSLRVEAFRLVLSNVPRDAKISGSIHVEKLGWVNYSDMSNGKIIGSVGYGRRVEALNMKLEGVPGYKLQYRVHIQNTGWTTWIDEGKNAGTAGYAKRIEALQIRIMQD